MDLEEEEYRRDAFYLLCSLFRYENKPTKGIQRLLSGALYKDVTCSLFFVAATIALNVVLRVIIGCSFDDLGEHRFHHQIHHEAAVLQHC